MQHAEKVIEQVIEQQVWEAPELVVSDVSTATQANVAAGSDGAIGS